MRINYLKMLHLILKLSHMSCNALACHGMTGIVCWRCAHRDHCWWASPRFNEKSQDVTSVSWWQLPRLSGQSQHWAITHDSRSVIVTLPFNHGPLDTSQVMGLMVRFWCILILPTVASSGDTILREERYFQAFRLFGDQGLGSTAFHFTQVRLKL